MFVLSRQGILIFPRVDDNQLENNVSSHERHKYLHFRPKIIWGLDHQARKVYFGPFISTRSTVSFIKCQDVIGVSTNSWIRVCNNLKQFFAFLKEIERNEKSFFFWLRVNHFVFLRQASSCSDRGCELILKINNESETGYQWVLIPSFLLKIILNYLFKYVSAKTSLKQQQMHLPIRDQVLSSH